MTEDSAGGAESCQRLGLPASRRLAFSAFRNSNPLGRHEISFSERDGELLVDISVEYAVKFGPVTFFRYKLRGRETWSNGVLISAAAQTDNNGKRDYMRADRDGETLIVEGSKARRTAAPRHCLLATHWNIAQLDGPMINPQDGSLLRFSVKPMGLSKLADSKRAPIMARRYALQGKNPLELWYEDSGLWVGLRAKAVDGSVISYVPESG